MKEGEEEEPQEGEVKTDSENSKTAAAAGSEAEGSQSNKTESKTTENEADRKYPSRLTLVESVVETRRSDVENPELQVEMETEKVANLAIQKSEAAVSARTSRSEDSSSTWASGVSELLPISNNSLFAPSTDRIPRTSLSRNGKLTPYALNDKDHKRLSDYDLSLSSRASVSSRTSSRFSLRAREKVSCEFSTLFCFYRS